MTDINVDLIHSEHATDFLEYGGACGLYAVSTEERVDVIGVDAVLVDDALTVATRELPQSGNI